MAVAGPLALAALLLANPDSDADGVPDSVDSFPCEAAASAEAYSPALGVHGTVYGEDFWPVRLDDDYQDLVLNYNYGFKIETNGARVLLARATFNLLASGGVIDTGLGVQLPVPASALASATMQIGNGAPIALTARGADQLLTLTLSNDLGADLFPGAPDIVNAIHPNTDPTRPNAGPIELIVMFNAPQTLASSSSPFDVFMFRTADGSHETHLSQYCGTAAMNQGLFGTGIDRSTLPGGPCYIDAAGLPAMLVIPQYAPYPLEQVNIASLFPQIVQWAASGGTTNQSWYTAPVASFAYPSPLMPAFNGGSALTADRSCACPAGYTGTAGSCVDVDECTANTDDCDVNATCTNTTGSFTCTCNGGFTGDGRTCSAVNVPIIYDQQLPSGAQCTTWNAWRSSLQPSAYYGAITMSGSIDPTGVTCTGDGANTLCDALRSNTSVSVTCGGRNWRTGPCGNGIELSANGSICSCPNPGYIVRPCIGNGNWGGINSNTCGGPAQTMRVVCTETMTVPRTLTVTTGGSIHGTVTSSPPGINCGGDCTEPYAYGTSVTLTANLNPGAVFLGWSGACSGTAPTCTVLVNANITVTALFGGPGSISFADQLPSGQQCTLWNGFRGALSASTNYTRVTIRGTNDALGVSCTGAGANTLCQALRTNSTVTVSCDGRSWRTGGCGNGLELSAEGSICSCPNPGYIVRPCIGNGNWGGVNSNTCGGGAQTIIVDCAN